MLMPLPLLHRWLVGARFIYTNIRMLTHHTSDASDEHSFKSCILRGIMLYIWCAPRVQNEYNDCVRFIYTILMPAFRGIVCPTYRTRHNTCIHMNGVYCQHLYTECTYRRQTPNEKSYTCARRCELNINILYNRYLIFGDDLRMICIQNAWACSMCIVSRSIQYRTRELGRHYYCCN